MLFLDEIYFERSIQCVYGECKYLPKCPRGCMGNLNWLTVNLPPTTAPHNPRPRASLQEV